MERENVEGFRQRTSEVLGISLGCHFNFENTLLHILPYYILNILLLFFEAFLFILMLLFFMSVKMCYC